MVIVDINAPKEQRRFLRNIIIVKLWSSNWVLKKHCVVSQYTASKYFCDLLSVLCTVDCH